MTSLVMPELPAPVVDQILIRLSSLTLEISSVVLVTSSGEVSDAGADLLVVPIFAMTYQSLLTKQQLVRKRHYKFHEWRSVSVVTGQASSLENSQKRAPNALDKDKSDINKGF